MNKKLSEFSTLSGITDKDKDIILNKSLIPCIYKKETDSYYTNANFKISEYFPSKDLVNALIGELETTFYKFKDESLIAHDAKLDKNQGSEYANRILITNPSGLIIFTGTEADCEELNGIAETISTIKYDLSLLNGTLTSLEERISELAGASSIDPETFQTLEATVSTLATSITALKNNLLELIDNLNEEVSELAAASSATKKYIKYPNYNDVYMDNTTILAAAGTNIAIEKDCWLCVIMSYDTNAGIIKINGVSLGVILSHYGDGANQFPLIIPLCNGDELYIQLASRHEFILYGTKELTF